MQSKLHRAKTTDATIKAHFRNFSGLQAKKVHFTETHNQSASMHAVKLAQLNLLAAFHRCGFNAILDADGVVQYPRVDTNAPDASSQPHVAEAVAAGSSDQPRAQQPAEQLRVKPLPESVGASRSTSPGPDRPISSSCRLNSTADQGNHGDGGQEHQLAIAAAGPAEEADQVMIDRQTPNGRDERFQLDQQRKRYMLSRENEYHGMLEALDSLLAAFEAASATQEGVPTIASSERGWRATARNEGGAQTDSRSADRSIGTISRDKNMEAPEPEGNDSDFEGEGMTTSGLPT